MEKKNTERVMLWTSVAGFLVMSLSFLLIPVEVLGYLPGALFWGGMICGIALQVLLDRRRRKSGTGRRRRNEKRIGFLSVGSNKEALVADCVFAGSIVFTVLAFVCTQGMGYVCYCAIGLMLFSFCMHCVLNGRNYHYFCKSQQRLNNKKVSTAREEEMK